MSDKVFSISDNPQPLNLMSEAERAKTILERTEKEKEDLSAQELVLDGTNKVAFPGFPYLFEAVHEKIIVSLDIFKSGYECKVCKGLKWIDTKCECEIEDRAGLKYSEEQIEELRRSIGEEVAHARESLPCPKCLGDYPSFRTREKCSSCKGLGATLILPETSKSQPTSGVIVSIGQTARRDFPWLEIGQRILFGPYAGNMVPTKAGLVFKILDASNAWCIVEGAEDLGQFDFILQDEMGVYGGRNEEDEVLACLGSTRNVSLCGYSCLLSRRRLHWPSCFGGWYIGCIRLLGSRLRRRSTSHHHYNPAPVGKEQCSNYSCSQLWHLEGLLLLLNQINSRRLRS